jgi:hypothetical protein
VSDPRKGCPPDPDDMVCMACGAVACPHQAGEMDRHHAAGFAAGVEAAAKVADEFLGGGRATECGDKIRALARLDKVSK